MAGDWIKMRVNLADDPAVITMATRLDAEEDVIVGKLHRFWSWADQQTTDGNAVGVTKKWIDRYISVTGFADSLEEVGWLIVKRGGITIPNFERHNGESGKRRTLTRDRVRNYREKNGSNANHVTKALPEKRREEKSKGEKEDNTEGVCFQQFWDAWPKHPRKVSKKKCHEIWKKKKLDPLTVHIVELVKLLATTEEWTKDKGQFIPAPLVWLNQERYDCALEDVRGLPEEPKESELAILERKMHEERAAVAKGREYHATGRS